jgi:hypothetical protein
MAIGRISGPLLKSNLLRSGVDLAFENDLLYLKVTKPGDTAQRIGINTNTPLYDLDVNGTTKSTFLNVAQTANIADITISGSTVSTTNPVLTLGTNDSVVYQNKLTVDGIEIENNVISTHETNTNLELRPNATGTVEIFANTNVYGDIVATGNITSDGNITLGDADTDNVEFNADINSNIVPNTTDTFALGTETQRWNDVWVNNLYSGTINANSLIVDGVDLALRQGNLFYVAENGDDAHSGTHPNDPFLTIKHAVENAAEGDTVHIYPGVFEETFPITVPAGVTVKGHSLRSVVIRPTIATQNNDAFLLNGSTTIQDLTIKQFYFDSGSNTGYAFKFATNFTVSGTTNRSPYISNVSVITNGSVTSGSDPRGFDQGDAGKGAYIDGAIALSSSNEASMLFHAATFITPGVDAITVTNGARVEWLNSFTYFANRSMYAFDGTTGINGTGKTSVRVDGLLGTIVAGNTFSYYDTDGTTVLATGTIDSVDADNKFYVNGNLTGLITATDRGGKIITKYGTPTTDTTIRKFGTSSLELNGTTDYIGVVSNNDFGFGTSNYTVEGWFYFDSVTAITTLFDFRGGAGSDIAPVVYIDAGGELRFYSYSADRIVGSTLSTGTWYHIAISRSGNDTKLFLDGVLDGTWTISPVDYGIAKPVIIGAQWDGANKLDGYVDEFRITKGTARYTSAFTAPTSQFTGDTDTTLLLHFNNAVDGSTIIVDDIVNSQDLRFSNGSSASYITLADQTDFGAEIRLIGSASIYGNYGLVGDGPGVIIYAVSHNMAYVGNGKLSTNDPLTIIQSNEVVESNDAQIRYNSVDHKGDFRVGDLFHVSQEDGTVAFSSSAVNITTQDGVVINTGGSQTTITGEKIDTGNLRLSGNTIESLSGDVILNADSGTVRIESNGALNLPTGTTAERPGSPVNGMMRYNTDNNLFEGYDGNWIALNGIYDLDLNTYITAELTPGANDNTIRFYADGALVADMDSTRLRSDRIEVDDIAIDGNVINTITTDTDLNLRGNGTGSVAIDNLSFKGNAITNTQSNGTTYFRNSGTGYVKIEGTGAFVVPVGQDIERPIPPYREIGMTRFNTDQQYLEIWNGVAWVSVAGSSGAITFNAAENLVLEYILVLG